MKDNIQQQAVRNCKRSFLRQLSAKSKSLMLLSLLFALLYALTPASVPNVGADVGEDEAPWVVSHYESGDLVLTPDSSLHQWTDGPRMLSFEAADEAEMSVMSVNNGTYVVFLVERVLTTSLSDAWVIIAFEGQAASGEDQIWFWTSASQGSTPLADDVSVNGQLAGEELTVTFGRTFAPQNPNSFELESGVPYDDFIKASSWSNGTSVDKLDLEALHHMGLEIFPYQDHYPKAPLVYGAVIVVAALFFLFSELRRYRGA